MGYGMLVLPARILRRMFGFRNKFKVGNMIIAFVAINMVNIIAFGNFAIDRYPYAAVQKRTTSTSASIIPVGSSGILFPSKHNKGKGFGFTEQQPSTLKSCKYCLPANAKCLSYLRTAKALFIQLVHFHCRLCVWFATHKFPFRISYIIPERLAGVN